MSSEYVRTPQRYDVLFGRGSGPNDHEGNVLFRSLVKERKAEYMATNHRQTKATIAHEVVEHIRLKSGRFLKKADVKDLRRLGLDEDDEVWCRVPEKQIMEKAKQALRQKEETITSDNKKASPAATQKKKSPPPSEPTSQQYGQQQHPVMQQFHGVMPEPYISGDIPAGDSQEPLDWRTFPGQAPAPGYLPASPPQQEHYMQQQVYNRTWSGERVLAEESPPAQNYGVEPQRTESITLDQLAEQGIHRSAAHGYSEHHDEAPIGDGPEDDDRRKSLQVEDLMRNFHRMGTDEMATSSSDNIDHATQSSNDTMGTIEPLPMGASTQSMMTSSTFSILKGALGESTTPRSSITRPANYKRDTSTGSKHDSSDMSLSFSQLEGVFDEGETKGSSSGHQVSKVLEGANEDESQEFLAPDPRPVAMMEADPESLPRFGNSSISILNTALADSGDTMTSSSGSMMDNKKMPSRK